MPRPTPLLALLLLPLLPGAAHAQEAIWAGTVRTNDLDVGVRVRISEGAGSARVSVPHFGWYDVAARVGRRDEALQVTCDVYGSRALLTLARDGDELRGTWDGWGARGEARLRTSQAKALTWTIQPFEFEHLGHGFRASLLLPAGEGPFPAIVWTHGSGPVDREDPLYRSHAAWLAEHGIASLIYAKRPPTADATMQVLADDAVAGARALAILPEIQRDLIGVGGLSQGGWVSPMAAARSDAIAFVVGLSAPGVSPAEQNDYNQSGRVARSASVEAANEASRILANVYRYLRTGDGAAEVRAELEQARTEPWFPAAIELRAWLTRGLPPAPWRYVSELDLDPGTAWREIDRPVLCVWGEDDTCVPPAISRERIGPWLDAAGNRVRELRTLPGAHHDLRLAPEGPWTMGAFPSGMNAIPRFVHALDPERSRRAERPPTAPREDAVEVHHGREIADPYAWMEPDDERVRAWARAQDDVTRADAAADPLVAKLEARMIELNDFAGAPVPVAAGEREFLQRQIPGRFTTDLRVRDRKDGTWRLLVDPNGHAASPGAELALGSPVPSPDGAYVLHGASSASLASCIRLVEVASATDRPDESLPIRHWPWVVSWLSDSSGFLWARGGVVRLHVMGMPTSEDEVVYRTTTEPTPHLAVRGDASDTHVFVTEHAANGEASRVLVHELGSGDPADAWAWRELAAAVPGEHQLVGQSGDRVFLYTTSGAPAGRVMAIDLARPEAPWVEVVPERAEPIYDDNHPMRPTVGLFGDRIAAMYARNGTVLVRAFDLDGRLQVEHEHDGFGSTESGLVGRADRPVARFDVASMYDRGRAFEVDLHTGDARVLGEPVVPFNPSEFTLSRTTYPSFDGTRVPVFLAHCRGLVRDGTHPVLMIDWGHSGLVMRPLYMPSYHAWLELGGVIALVGARGGGEFGGAWREAGRGVNKLTSIDDLGACAGWLASSGISRPDRIALLGSSMSGPSAAAAFVRHRDALGAGLFQIPRIDLLATDGWWREEYGDIAVRDELAAMLEWLPLQNVEPGLHPPALVQVGSEDAVARPFHGYKWVAALQHAQRGSGEVRLQVVWGAGHSQGTGVPTRSATLALQFAWLARALGHRP
ncbi:MAG: prolyl oligopeptidase family serine peptidase [Planctomycetota bacterium]